MANQPRKRYKKYKTCGFDEDTLPASTLRRHKRQRESRNSDSGAEEENLLHQRFEENLFLNFGEVPDDQIRENPITLPEVSLLRHQERENTIQYNIDKYNNFTPDVNILANDEDIESLSLYDESSTEWSDVEQSENDESDDIEPDVIENDSDFDENLELSSSRTPQREFSVMNLGSLTKNESASIIMAYALRHNITEEGLNDLIRLANLHSPGDIHTSKYEFLKDFIMPEAHKIFYCLPCHKILDFTQSSSVVCNKCKKTYYQTKLKQSGSYFYHLPLLPQLIRLTKSEDYRLMRQDMNEKKSDVIHGSVYKNSQAQGIIGKNDISIQWNTDGVNLFNTSSSSIWPIQVAINELPYRIRNKNILLSGIWFGASKPPMNMYLEPFINELNALSANGFRTTPITSDHEIVIKVHVILATVDSIARPMIQNTKQFNGLFGCSMCLHPGDIAEGTKNSRVYSGSVHALRTRAYHIACVKRRNELQRCDALKGIKGPSILMLLDHFSVPEDCPPDYMHAVLEGVVKFLLTLSFNSRYHQEKWYLGDKKNSNEIAERLNLIRPCCEIRRTTRPIDKIKFWTAAEFKYFLLYYSLPCFENIMKAEYFENWFLLVYSISIFSQDYISPEDFVSAKTALVEFVHGFEVLYVKKNMRYNVHLLLHIPHSVERFGAVWAWSNFPFETFNGVLKRLFHGSQFIPDQIVKIYSRMTYIKTAPNDFEKPDCNELAKSFFLSLIKSSKLEQNNFDDSFSTKGAFSERLLSGVEKILFNQQDVEERFVKSYKRFVLKNNIYHAHQSHSLMKRNNSIIETKDELFIKITELLKISDDNYQVLGKKLEISRNEVLHEKNNWSGNKFCKKVIESDQLICCSLNEIKRKCVIIQCYSEENIKKFYVFPLINDNERD